MGSAVITARRGTTQRHATGASHAPEHGFTLVEMTTSVAVLLVVLTAAWMLLTVSNNNLNRIDYGGQASELNRAALASFERDLGHAYLPSNGGSAVLVAGTRSCSLMVDTDNDDRPELVTWMADDSNQRLLRVVKRMPDAKGPAEMLAATDFNGGVATTSTVLTGLAGPADLDTRPMFSYAIDAAQPDWGGDASKIGLITFRLRNGLPDNQSNVVDRTGAFRVIAYVINGY